MRNVAAGLSGLFILGVMAIGIATLSQKDEGRETQAWFKKAPVVDNAVFERILEDRKKGDFDGAVAAALEGVGGKPPDDFLLQAVSDIYFEEAQQGDDAKRGQWVGLAVQYSERALATNPTDVVNVFNVGEAYLTAAMNLHKPAGCGYYAESLKVFEQLRRDPILDGKLGTVEGEQVLMEPYRQRLDGKIRQVRELSEGCIAVAVKY